MSWKDIVMKSMPERKADLVSGMAARRILSGMGTKEKDLCAVERSLGIERDPDETVFERASSVWRKTCGWLSRSGISCIDWIETRPSDMEALAEEAVDRGECSVLCCRMYGTTCMKALVCLRTRDARREGCPAVQRGSSLMEERDGYDVWALDLEKLVRKSSEAAHN